MSSNRTGAPAGRRLLSRVLALSLMTGSALTAAATWPALAQQQSVTLAVPAGSLAGALNSLARQTGLQIGYDSALVRGRSSRGLSGAFLPREALERLLAGTGIEATFSGQRTVTLASDAPSPAGEPQLEDGATVLQTLTVSGEKLTRDYFRTYTSVGVATGEDLSNRNTQSVGQALNRMGNVRSLPSGSGNNRIAIRGLDSEGVTQPSRSAPIISVTVDGALQGVEANRRGSRSAWDVEQVEVLRGPQSTIQGRNALGGAVIVKTKDPTWDPEVIVEGQLATPELKSAAVALSAPIVPDQVAFRVAGQVFRDTKDISYADPSIAALREDELEEIRAKLLVTPHALPDLTALFTVSRTHDKPGWGLVSGPDFFARRFDDVTKASAEFRDTYVNRYVADLNYALSPDWGFNSVSAITTTDVGISSAPGSSLGRSETRNELDLSQDLRFTYDSPDSPVSGIFGLFAGRFTNTVDSFITTDFFAPFIPIVTVQDLDAETQTTSIAAYADLRYRFGERWTLMGGGRLLRDEVTSNYAGEALDVDASILAGFPVFGSLDENTSIASVAFLPKLGLAYDLTDDQTISATVSRGYRAGFAETVAGSATINQVDPEYMWSYELGYRSRWMDERLQVFANAFYYDYENQQIQTDIVGFPGQTKTENAGESHAYGAELEVRYQTLEGLELFSSLGLLKTEFDTALTSAGNLAGNEFPEAPTFTATLGGLWRHDSGFFAGADVSYTDGFYSAGDLANTAARRLDGFAIVNAQVGYEFEHGSVTAYARNLFDNQYLTSISSDLSQATIGDGLSLGVRAKAQF